MPDETLSFVKDHPYKKQMKEQGFAFSGELSTWQKCPKCKGKFKRYFKSSTEIILKCPVCQTTPTRYQLDIFYQSKRYRISRDQRGFALTSPQMANLLLNNIRANLDKFDPSQYLRRPKQAYQFLRILSLWLADCKTKMDSNELAFGTFVLKRGYAQNYYLPFFKDMDIRDIRKHHLVEFKQTLNLKPNTINSILDQLQSLFCFITDSFEDDDLKLPNLKRVPTIKANEPDVVISEDQSKILDAIDPKHQPIFRFMVLTGCRPAQARSLQKTDIDFKNNRIIFQHNYSAGKFTQRPKSKRSLYFPLYEELKIFLKSLKYDVISSFVFINPDTNKPYNHALNNILYPACDKVGLPRITVKNFARHSFEYNKLELGLTEGDIADLLGHSSENITRKHYHVLNIKRLGKLLDHDNGTTKVKEGSSGNPHQ